MTRLFTITVARKPLSEGSVAKNALKHGTGGFNIDSCRVAHVTVPGGQATNPHLRDPIRAQGKSSENLLFAREGVLAPTNANGRWPANLILLHKPGCERTGTKKVKSDGHWRPAGDSTREMTFQGGWGEAGKDEGNRLADEDGTETVEAWECESGCPVADLDGQSGDLRARGNLGVSKGGGGMYGHGPTTNAFGTGDTGGASRFFKQVGGEL
jgi:hypothetical protein